MSNLLKRTLTGIGFIAVLVAGITVNKYTFFSLFIIISFLGLREFYRLIKKTGISPQFLPGVIAGLYIYTSTYLYYDQLVSDFIFYFSLPAGLIIVLIEIFRDQKRPFENIALTLFGILYVILPFTFFNYFVFKSTGQPTYKSDILIAFFILQWVSDTGAYVVGMPLGKHKLNKKISPNKSWEGFIGGIIITVASGYIIYLFFDYFSPVHWMIIGFLISFFGTLGDLLESKLKRSVDEKDSGNLLPGHGGILDRFDSVLLSSPIIFAYLQIIN